MSAQDTDALAPEPAPAHAPWRDPAWRTTALIGTLLLGALVLALAARDSGARVASIAIAVAALPLVAALLGPGAVRRLRGTDGAALLSALPLLGLPLLAVALARLSGRHIPGLLVTATLLALCGIVLVSYDLHGRARSAGARATRSPWRQLTAGERVRVLPWRVVLGVLLIGCAAWLALGALAPYASHVPGRSLLAPYISRVGGFSSIVVAVIGLGAITLVALPFAVGSFATSDRDRLGRAREDERARVAAHLHDSVLQTLSLVQRQAGDPVAVARLARHQERALRAWLAGQPEAREETLAGALHAAIEEVEDEHAVTIEATVLGDVALAGRGEALAAATREALRNAARHAPGAAIVVFAELGPGGAEVYVRDEGPGFDLDAVPEGRRGVRDSILARMTSVGGSATIETAAGEGTEVALRLPPTDRRPR